MPNNKVRQAPQKGKNKMNSIKTIARVVGLLYVFIEICGLLSISYVPTDPSHAATVWLAMSSVLAELVVANATWSGLCVFTATVLAGTASQSTERPWRGGRRGGRPHGCPGS